MKQYYAFEILAGIVITIIMEGKLFTFNFEKS